jgi:hypothetical protein
MLTTLLKPHLQVARKNALANGFATGAADGGPRVLVLQVTLPLSLLGPLGLRLYLECCR